MTMNLSIAAGVAIVVISGIAIYRGWRADLRDSMAKMVKPEVDDQIYLPTLADWASSLEIIFEASVLILDPALRLLAIGGSMTGRLGGVVALGVHIIDIFGSKSAHQLLRCAKISTKDGISSCEVSLNDRNILCTLGSVGGSYIICVLRGEG